MRSDVSHAMEDCRQHKTARTTERKRKKSRKQPGSHHKRSNGTEESDEQPHDHECEKFGAAPRVFPFLHGIGGRRHLVLVMEFRHQISSSRFRVGCGSPDSPVRRRFHGRRSSTTAASRDTALIGKLGAVPRRHCVNRLGCFRSPQSPWNRTTAPRAQHRTSPAAAANSSQHRGRDPGNPTGSCGQSPGSTPSSRSKGPRPKVVERPISSALAISLSRSLRSKMNRKVAGCRWPRSNTSKGRAHAPETVGGRNRNGLADQVGITVRIRPECAHGGGKMLRSNSG